MTVNLKTLIPAKVAESVQTTQYTAINCRAVIDKFTATNNGTSNATLSVNIVASGDSSSSGNLIVNARAIAPNETYTFPELVGHSIGPGSFISTIASASSSLTIRASGREIT